MGEPRALLREALLGLTTRRRDDGTLELVGGIPPRLADPLSRALDRVCEEIADDDRRRGVPVREGGYLRGAAVMALLLRVSDG